MSSILEKRARALIEAIATKKKSPKRAVAEIVSVISAESKTGLTEGTASFFIPDQDKLNRTVLRFRQAYPDGAEPSIEQKGAGYTVKFTIPGGGGLGHLSSLVAGLGGAFQIPNDGETWPGADVKPATF